MITIVNKFTGKVICKYRNADKQFATKDSFIANVKGNNTFRNRFNAIVLFYNKGNNWIQCELRPMYAVLEYLTKEDKEYWEI